MNDFNYQIKVKKINNQDYLAITELGLKTLVTDNFQQSLNELNLKKDQYIKDMQEMNAAFDIPRPKENGGISLSENKWIKEIIHCSLIVGSFLIGGLLASLLIAREGKKLTTNLHRAIYPDELSQQKKIKSFRDNLEASRPYLRDFYEFVESEKKYLQNKK